MATEFPDSYYDMVGLPRPTATRAGSSESSSTSTPTFLETPQNAIMDEISRVASGLARQMEGWANNVFANTSRITDQAVGNFYQVSNQMLGLSGNLTDQYNNIFAPQNASLAREANEYNSAARQRVNMGMAGATQRQAGDAALRSSEEALRSYGINPSDGRYAALDKASRVQNAANVAGAMNMERERTAQVGRDLRRDAVQIGAMLPAAISNVNNTAIQANTGASNASLANANTGRNLQTLPNDYLRTAMDLKMPISGQNSQSKSSSQSYPPAGSGGGIRSDSGGGGGRMSGGGGGGGARMGGAERSSPAWMPQHGSGQNSRGGYGEPGGYMPGAAIMRVPSYGGRQEAATFQNPWENYDTSWPLEGVDAGQWTGENDIYQPYEDYGIGYDANFQSSEPFNDYGGSGYDQWGFDQYDFGNQGWDQTYGQGGDYNTYGNIDGGYDTQYGNIAYDPGANSYDPGWGETYDTPSSTDWGSGADAFNDYGWGSSSYDTTSSDSDFYAGDWSGNYDDYGGVFAGGGPVDPSQSPSGGRMVDDVPAQAPGGDVRLNSDEFVIPRDVALWKGQEFFQKLIDQSRKARVTAPAQGAQPPGPPRQNPPMQAMR